MNRRTEAGAHLAVSMLLHRALFTVNGAGSVVLGAIQCDQSHLVVPSWKKADDVLVGESANA